MRSVFPYIIKFISAAGMYISPAEMYISRAEIYISRREMKFFSYVKCFWE